MIAPLIFFYPKNQFSKNCLQKQKKDILYMYKNKEGKVNK